MIEPLESRIAPAFTFVSPTLVTFIDVDGDLVTIKSSKPVLDDADFIRVAQGVPDGHRLQSILLSDDGTAADGMNLTITATPQNGRGDGFVNIGLIDATGRVLGAVVVDGDLQTIDAGNTGVNAFALQSLTVQSMGRLTEQNQGPAASDLEGSVKSIVIKGDMRDSFVNITGEVSGVKSSLGAFTVGGTISSTPEAGLGGINVAGNIGPVKVGGSVLGGPEVSSAQIGAVGGSIKSVTIGGDVIGGSISFSAYIYASTSMGAVTIGGDVRGGGGGNAGFLAAGTSMGAVKIGGSLIGSVDQFTGSIQAGTDLGMVTIRGDMEGRGGFKSGTIQTINGNIAGVSIGGSLRGGSFDSAGSILASIQAGSAGKLGAVKISGDVLGGTSTNTARISAAGGIGPVTIGGSLLGGSMADSGLLASGGTLGAVKIGGKVEGGGGARSGFILSTTSDIASVTIGGSLTGGGGEDSGSIQAGGSLVAVKIGGDLKGGALDRSGRLFATQNIGAITIGGSMIGGGGFESGTIKIGDAGDVKQTIASITIGGDVRGGGGNFSGALTAQILTDDSDFVGKVKVAGDWIGGTGPNSGTIRIGNIGSIAVGGSFVGGSNGTAGFWNLATIGSATIGGDVIGGSASNTGYIAASEFMKSLKIGGSLIGGTASESGMIDGNAGVITIGRDLRGGDVSAGTLTDSGLIRCTFASVTIGGSIFAGRESGGGELVRSGAIYNVRALGAITVKGSLVGTPTEDVSIAAGGSIDLTPGLPPFVAIKSLTVGGRVEHALISAGIDHNGLAIDPDCQIGPVKVGGDWIASSLIAGLDPVNGMVGEGSDIKADLAMRDHPELFSKIASIVIGGHVLADLGVLNRTYGFAAEEIGSFKVNGIALKLNPGRGTDKFTGLGVAGNAVPVGPIGSLFVSDGFAVHVFEI